MSEVFDPDKVKRWETGCDDCSEGERADGTWVLASEFDKLLALYRELQRSFAVGQNQEHPRWLNWEDCMRNPPR